MSSSYWHQMHGTLLHQLDLLVLRDTSPHLHAWSRSLLRVQRTCAHLCVCLQDAVQAACTAPCKPLTPSHTQIQLSFDHIILIVHPPCGNPPSLDTHRSASWPLPWCPCPPSPRQLLSDGLLGSWILHLTPVLLLVDATQSDTGQVMGSREVTQAVGARLWIRFLVRSS